MLTVNTPFLDRHSLSPNTVGWLVPQSMPVLVRIIQRHPESDIAKSETSTSYIVLCTIRIRAAICNGFKTAEILKKVSQPLLVKSSVVVYCRDRVAQWIGGESE